MSSEIYGSRYQNIILLNEFHNFGSTLQAVKNTLPLFL